MRALVVCWQPGDVAVGSYRPQRGRRRQGEVGCSVFGRLVGMEGLLLLLELVEPPRLLVQNQPGSLVSDLLDDPVRVLELLCRGKDVHVPAQAEFVALRHCVYVCVWWLYCRVGEATEPEGVRWYHVSW